MTEFNDWMNSGDEYDDAMDHIHTNEEFDDDFETNTSNEFQEFENLIIDDRKPITPDDIDQLADTAPED